MRFPQVLCSLTTLERLFFNSQHLGRIPQEITQLTRLSFLSIDGYASPDISCAPVSGMSPLFKVYGLELNIEHCVERCWCIQ